MPFAVFGPGTVYVQRTDIANATPVNVGYANEFSIDESSTTKSLYGENQYPLVTARGTVKTTGKLKAAMISGIALDVYHGQGLTTGQLLVAVREAGTVPASTTYTVTVANSATFDTDLGVVYASNNLPFAKVASGPTIGQYSVAAGVYTFAAADASVAVGISYASTATGGQKKIVTNKKIGTTPTFQLDYATSLNGNPYVVRLFQVIASKLTQQFKLEDFMMPELDFEYFANAAGQVYEVSYPQVG
jgi:hypothetical protein